MPAGQVHSDRCVQGNPIPCQKLCPRAVVSFHTLRRAKSTATNAVKAIPIPCPQLCSRLGTSYHETCIFHVKTGLASITISFPLPPSCAISSPLAVFVYVPCCVSLEHESFDLLLQTPLCNLPSLHLPLDKYHFFPSQNPSSPRRPILVVHFLKVGTLTSLHLVGSSSR